MRVFLAAALLAGSWSALIAENPSPLLKIKRVYVDALAGGEAAPQIRDMIISALQNTGLFTITESEERSDAVLRGSADDQVFTEDHNSSDSINTNFHSSSGSSKTAGSKYAGGGVGENENSHISERRHEASAAVRLVSKEGDVVWSTTQESFGARFRGSSADVADKITRRLVDDYNRARNGPGTSPKRLTVRD